jgi:hypothetical protein
VVEGSPALFQCQVKSSTEPHITWLKKLDATQNVENDATFQDDDNNDVLPVDNQRFRILRLSQVVRNGNDLYTSKLFLKETRISDSGMYIW